MAGSLAMLACGPESGGNPPTDLDPSDVDPQFIFTNGPQAPGPVVFRQAAEPNVYSFLFPDDKAGLTATAGVVGTPAEACDPANPNFAEPIDFQFLFSPTGRLLEHGRAELSLVVYEGSTTDFCGALLSAPVIGTGIVQLVENDPDFNGSRGGPSFGYHAQGPVQLVSGGKARFSGTVKFVTTGTGKLAHVVSHVELTGLP
jgi:hypothetical protein